MSFTPPPSPPDAPGATPQRGVPATFSALMDAFLVWMGTFRTWLAAFVVYLGTFQTELTAAIAGINAAIAGGAIDIDYTFDTTITDADPGAGKLRLSSATQNTSTVMRLDLTDANGIDQTATLALFPGSTSTVKGFLTLRKAGDGTKFIIFSITSMASPSGYRNVTVAVVGSSSANPFTNGDALTLTYDRNGDKGDQGIQGNPGTLSGTAVGAIDLLTGASIAGSSTPNLNTRTGDRLHITGAGWNITAPTLTRGPVHVVFDGIGTLTHNATTHNLPGAANITTAAGDRAIYESDGTTVYLSFYQKVDGSALTGGGQALGAAGTAVVANTATTGNFGAVCALSATRSMGLYLNASNFPVAITRDAAGATIATQQIVGNAAAVNVRPVIRAVPGSATQAIAIWSESSITNVALLTDTGVGITVTVLTQLPSIAACQAVGLAMHSSTKAIAFGSYSAGATLIYSVIAYTTTTVTPGASTQLAALTANATSLCVRAAEFSATQGVMLYSSGTNTSVVAVPYTESSGTVTAGVSSTVADTVTTTGSSHADAINLSATRVLAACVTEARSGPSTAFTLDISGTGSTAEVASGPAVLFAGSSQRPRLAKVSNTAAIVALQAQSSASQILIPLKISGQNLSRGEGLSYAKSTGGVEVCVTGSNVVPFYSDSLNSGYPTSRPIALNTVV